jgi:hypothetical protein
VIVCRIFKLVMNIKQTVIRLVIGLVVAISMSTAVLVPAYAASCGGVQTAIINCTQAGGCPSNPTEGTDPKGDSTLIAAYRAAFGHDYGMSYTADEGGNPGSDQKSIDKYKSTYGHQYGKCMDGSVPNKTTISNGLWGLLLMAINILTGLIVVAAIGGLVYAGILYTSSGGNADQTKKAMEFIRNVIIGIVAYAVMFAVLNFIIPGGLFN